MGKQLSVSVVVPAKNEAENLRQWLPRLISQGGYDELVVVDDGSDDDTSEVARVHGARVFRHEQSLGNGAAIKKGFREAHGDLVVFMDADGQHQPEEIPGLLDAMKENDADMVVGSRDQGGQASKARHLANKFYNRFASFVTGHKIEDLTSGFRAVKANKFSQFLSLLPNGFSYPTTSTMAFFRSGYSVIYYPISVQKRLGKSHISPLKDGIRFVLIIFKVATLYSPLKVFFPIAVLTFFLGLGRYLYTYLEMGTFTNMSALLMVSAVQIFLVGLVSEQITALMYKEK
ncbi:glycosyltransferase family 2 protein [Microbulbifer sp. YPW16]|uniref:glycosyltransferase family 2 protein n=1 Tax=Microbulbifer sp. YPW16 TaxID=2904242 RepID=UPI001E443B3B|nr:glycosyltransferase family 2 protein [Microbulbifer sp. YPW16]UHQ54871.1 glycosyltransferase family 2 protein [Microbulbifer sp. YPW16]